MNMNFRLLWIWTLDYYGYLLILEYQNLKRVLWILNLIIGNLLVSLWLVYMKKPLWFQKKIRRVGLELAKQQLDIGFRQWRRGGNHSTSKKYSTILSSHSQFTRKRHCGKPLHRVLQTILLDLVLFMSQGRLGRFGQYLHCQAKTKVWYFWGRFFHFFMSKYVF